MCADLELRHSTSREDGTHLNVRLLPEPQQDIKQLQLKGHQQAMLVLHNVLEQIESRLSLFRILWSSYVSQLGATPRQGALTHLDTLQGS